MIIDTVRTFLLRECFQGQDDAEIPEDQSLIHSGLLDSVGTLKLVLFLEQSFGIDIDGSDIADGKIDTLTAIDTLVSTKNST